MLDLPNDVKVIAIAVLSYNFYKIHWIDLNSVLLSIISWHRNEFMNKCNQASGIASPHTNEDFMSDMLQK